MAKASSKDEKTAAKLRKLSKSDLIRQTQVSTTCLQSRRWSDGKEQLLAL